MRNILLVLVLLLVVPPRSHGDPSATADTIFTNGNVYTVNDAAPLPDAIAIKGERILFVGSNDQAKKYPVPARAPSI